LKSEKKTRPRGGFENHQEKGSKIKTTTTSHTRENRKKHRGRKKNLSMGGSRGTLKEESRGEGARNAGLKKSQKKIERWDGKYRNTKGEEKPKKKKKKNQKKKKKKKQTNKGE